MTKLENSIPHSRMGVSTIVPFEKMFSMTDVFCQQGDNLAKKECSITAKNDLDAIKIWLSLHQENAHTYRAYRKESERFLLFCVNERLKPFSSANTEDCLAYRQFMAHPSKKWIGDMNERNLAEWRPFQNKLSKRSIQYTEIILNGLFTWLVKCNYLSINPYDQLPKKTAQAAIKIDHSISEELWLDIIAYCQTKITTTDTKTKNTWMRYYFVLRLGYGTGLRIHELVALTLNDIVISYRNKQKQAWLNVEGKGSKIREVPFPFWLQDDLSLYLTSRGLSSVIQDNPIDTPVIGKLKGKGELTTIGMHKLVKKMFSSLYSELTYQAKDESQSQSLDYGILLNASTHWLRHTHGTHQADKGVPLHFIRDNLGHASIATTSIYTHSDKSKRYDAIETLND